MQLQGCISKEIWGLQFLCTDSNANRSNKITRVTMVGSAKQIVHARGTKYGVCTNSFSLYSCKVCGVVRYNPACTLRLGMKGYRTLRLQQAFNALGLDAEAKPLSESAGEEPSIQKPILVTGGSVYIRTGPGREYASVMIAHKGDALQGIDTEGWNPILLDGKVRWISQKYSTPQR